MIEACDKQLEHIALVDMDGTIADFDKGLRELMAEFTSPNDPPYNLYNPDTPIHQKRLAKFVRCQSGFWTELPVIERGIEVVSILKEAGFRVHILTKGPVGTENAWTEKLQWCKKNLKDVLGEMERDYGFSITLDKGLFYGKILFDDFPPYCDRWLEWRPRGLVIQLETDYNKDYNHPNAIRYDGTNLDEIRKKIYDAKERINNA